MADLKNIESIGFQLTVSNNSLLESLTGLESLINVDNRIRITDNVVLNDFCGIKPLLQNLSNNLPDIEIEKNLSNPTAQEITESNCSQ
ncbi:hypothetical protein [Ulvibacterium sp.]|uniref:hypothetical protein n=1 Tax=Ulvibacterium sp. TaxID=2665914 RepID=UPI003BABD91C